MSKIYRTRSKIASAIVSTVLVTGALASVSHARGVRPATYSGTNGVLVYVASTGMGPTMKTGLRASTLAGVEQQNDLGATNTPEFSADGSKAVWLESAGSNWAIKIANSDGTNKVTLISGSGSPVANNPTFSPNGNFVAFDYSNDIYVLPSTSTNKAIADASRLTTSTSGKMAYRPKYLSATTIAYVGQQGTNACANAMYAGIYVKDTTVAGNGTLLTNSCNDGQNRTYPFDFDVSPDGQWIVYGGNATNGFIALIKADNTGSRIPVYSGTSFSDSPDSTSRPLFSPDGTKIIYSKGTGFEIVSFDGSTVGSASAVTFPSGFRVAGKIAWAPTSAILTSATTAAPTTTTAPTTTAPTTTTVPKATITSVIPGVTVTDTKVYVEAPAKVASASAIDVLTPAQAKTSDIVSKTPSVCLPNDEDLVFIDEGRCIAQVVNEKTRKVLRTLKTTVVADEVSELKVGNEIAVLSPLYFTAGTSTMKASSVRRLNSLIPQVKAAGSILVAGHSGVLMGDTAENRALSRERANTVVAALKKRGAKADFAIAAVGALDPVTTGNTQSAQDKNRRAVIVLIP